MPTGSSLEQRKNLVLWGLTTTFLSLIPTAYACIISNSVTLYADFLRCFAEFFAIFLSWLVIRKMLREDQSTFNYGFGKLEQLASLAVATALFITFLISFCIGAARFIQPEPIEGGLFGFVFAILSVMGNMFLWAKNYLHWRNDPSPLVESHWKLFRAKTFATLVVAISVGAGLYFYQYKFCLYLDAMGSITLSLFLLYSAYSMVSQSMTDLLDRALDEQMQLMVMRTLIAHEEKYTGLGDILSRRSGTKMFVTISLGFDNQLTLGKIYSAIKEIRDELHSSLEGVEITIIPQCDPT